jgi:parallel beta-helix repeat protein
MKTLLCVLIALVVATPAVAETYVTEDITTDATWNLAGSPYIIQAYVKVITPNTLTIEPGVVVEFDGFTQLKAYNGGSIVAIGTYGNEILFTSHSATPAPDDWHSVYMFYSPASAFSYCIFEYGRYTLYADRCSSTVSYCTSRYGKYGFMCENGSFLIENCDIVDNERGIKISGSDSNPVIHNCNLYNNTYQNIYVSDYADPPVVTIDAENNWWGTDVEAEIEDTITLSGSALYVEVDFDPWLHEVPVDVSSWGRVKALFAR